MTLGDEGGNRRRSDTDAADPAAEITGEQVREADSYGGEGDVRKAHEHQPTVGTIERVGQPDQRGRGDVVQRRVVGNPHRSVAVVTARVALGLPLRGAGGHVGRLGDLREIETGDLVGVADVGRFVGGDERRLLERVHRRDADEHDDRPENPEANRVATKGHASTTTKSRSQLHASSPSGPPISARPLPLPARDDMRASSTSSHSESPGPT